MSEHPIEGLMMTAMDSIKDMIDVNTIIGEPIESQKGITIIPISKVCLGFASGGSEFNGETIDEYKKVEKEEQIQYRLPFGGGAGAGISINPEAFLVIQDECVKLMPVKHSSNLDKLLDYVPDLIEKTNCALNKMANNKKEKTERIIREMQKRSKEVKNQEATENANANKSNAVDNVEIDEDV